MAKVVPTTKPKTETGCRPGQWFGPWEIEPESLASYLAAVQASDLKAVAERSAAMPSPPAYTVDANGLATINVTGPMAKYGSSVQSLLGGTSTVEKRQALRAAVRDPEVKAIMMRFDSPGGTVAGTGDFAAAVAKADQSKPVYAYIEDLGASAAYRVASRARRIYANADALVGSIGTYAVLTDSSGAYAKEGVKVHVVKSGNFKGTGEPGAPISEEQLEETQRRVTAMNEQFLADVATGRKLPMESVRALADGRVHMAAAAKQMGLIDSVASLEQATQEIGRMFMDEDNAVALAAENAELKAKFAALQADAEQAKSALAAIERKEKLAAVKAKLAEQKLPAAEGFAEALLDIEAAAPGAYAILDKQITAWAAQIDTAKLFAEVGTSESGKGPVDIHNPDALRAAADALVAAGTAKDRAAGIAQLIRKQGGN